MRDRRSAIRRLKGAFAVVAALALLAANDPRLAPEPPSPSHRHAVETTCCGAVKSCCSDVSPPADRVAPAPECACCTPAEPAPSPTGDAREAAVTSEREQVDAPEAVAAVAPRTFPRAESASPLPLPRALANDPPVFLRTCHLRF